MASAFEYLLRLFIDINKKPRDKSRGFLLMRNFLFLVHSGVLSVCIGAGFLSDEIHHPA